MNRKQALQAMAVIGGGTIIGLDLFLSGCKASGTKELNFSPETLALLDQIGEIIIPTTHTPGAKATQIGTFIKTFVSDCYTHEQQQVVMNGIADIDKQANSAYGKKFMQLSVTQQNELLTKLDKEAKTENLSTQGKKDAPPPHYFTLLKQLTVFGYFTSEIGQTEVLDYRPVPGSWNGCAPYKKGEKYFV